jgi:hypothetical protein
MENHKLAQRRRSQKRRAINLDLMETLANELNNCEWEFDGYSTARAAVDRKTLKMVIVISKGDEIIDLCLTVTHRRNHGRKKPQGKSRKRNAGVRS